MSGSSRPTGAGAEAASPGGGMFSFSPYSPDRLEQAAAVLPAGTEKVAGC